MAEITFELPDGQIQAIEFDATTRDTHDSSSEVTEHPIETGANISDHVKPNLDTVELLAVVSNEPIRQPGTQMDGVTSRQAGLEIRDAQTGIVLAKASVLVFDGEFDRVRTVYEELLRIHKSATVVGIITSLREYENMLIRRVSPIREASTGDSLIVTVEATEINIVSSEVVEAPEPVETRGRRRRNRGRNNSSDDDEASDTRNRSFLVQIVDSIQSFTGADDIAPVPPPPPGL